MPHAAAPADAQTRLALLSVLASGMLALLKLAVADSSGSLALLSSALDAGVDIGITAVTFWVVRAAERPPDRDHHFGHARFESVAALMQTLVLLGIGGFVVRMALQQLTGGRMTMVMERTPIAIATLALSAGVDLWRTTALGRAARSSGSPALAAAALNFRLDFLTSLGLLASLASVRLGIRSADPIAAAVIGVVMLVSAVRLLRETVHGMTDRAPAGVVERVRDALHDLPGAEQIGAVRARQMGSRIHVELTLLVPSDTTLRDTEALKMLTCARVAAMVPGAACVVVAEPR